MHVLQLYGDFTVDFGLFIVHRWTVQHLLQELDLLIKVIFGRFTHL